MKDTTVLKTLDSIHSPSFPCRVVSSVMVLLAFAGALCFGQNTRVLPTLIDMAPTGAIVDQVISGGPAAKAGISPHDVITAVEGTAVQSLKQIADALARHKPGDTLELTVAQASDGTITEVRMTLGANPRDASKAYMGLSLRGYMFLVPEDGTMPGQKDVPPGI